MEVFVTAGSHFLVCGLGSLGQYCVAALKKFGGRVSAIDISRPQSWEVKNLPDLLEDFVLGDCRQPHILQQTQIQQLRAVLLVTNNERINIETAFAVRLLNPHVRLVVRSSEQKLNQLLDQQLGNFTAFEMSDLPAPALAIATLANETQGLITLDEHLLRIVRCSIDSDHRWRDRRFVQELNNRKRRVLSHYPHTTAPPAEFHQWEPEARIRAGDTVIYIEITENLGDFVQSNAIPAGQSKRTIKQRWEYLRQQLSSLDLQQLPSQLRQFLSQQQSKRVAILVGITVLSLVILGTTILKAAHPQESWLKALYVSSVMLLGSYDVVFGALSSADTIPVWMRFLNLSYMLAGTASIAVLYALLTESLLAAKFELPNKRPPVPEQDHVVLIGLDRVGRQVVRYLQKLKQPLVGVSDATLEHNILPEMPLVVGDFRDVLEDANLNTARSVLVATDNEMANLEIGLLVHATNPDAALVIQTFEPDFSDNLARLLPYAKVLCSYSLAAEVFAAAVYGDHILDLLQLNEHTVLVAEYKVQSEDSLQGLLLADVAYGYGIVPLFYQAFSESTGLLLPSDDIKLNVGDRLIVLASVDSLHQIDQGEKLPRHWQVQINNAASRGAVFEGARIITRITGCSINTATTVMNNLPAPVPILLYKYQALRLVRELSKIQTQAHLIEGIGNRE
ncbi:NAD-binding protein [Fortiea contorta]|uniref:NAD-binding protein n=1 Tax=Fortiea contorta TaxID=1892405 RepID=UPI00034D7BFC|nr:NAD-binding protein [Fortiea contorta]